MSGDGRGAGRESVPPQGPEDALRELAAARYLSVTTSRRDGRTVATPVWFLRRDGHLWARSDAESGKVKRIRHNPPVRLAPCERDGTPTGPPVAAVAAVVPRQEHPAVYRALIRRYGPTAALYDLYWTRLKGTYTVLMRFALSDPDQPGS